MRHRLPLILSTTALLVAVLGATPIAGAVETALLPARSVGTDQLRTGAVTSTKIRNGAVAAVDVRPRSLTGAQVRDGSLLAVDFKPGQLPAGPKGDKGDPGATTVVHRRGQASLDSGGIARAVARCAEGETLVGGGGALLRAGDTISADPNVHLLGDYPVTDAGAPPTDGTPARAWAALARASEPSSTRVVAFAACAKP
jgi:hypothetical protein